MPTNTTTYSLQKPTVGGDEDAWGGYINSNLDAIDDLLDGTTPVTGIDINSGAIDGTPIGANSASTGAFSTIVGTTLNLSTGLAANLDTNGQDIVTSSNADLDLAPNGTGKVVVRGNTNSGKIVLNCENNSHGVTLASPPHSASATYEVALPNALGTTNASAVVTTDANGNLYAVFNIPAETFYVGDRVLEVADIDTYSSIDSGSTSKGFITYRAYNFSVEKTALTTSTRQPDFDVNTRTTTRNVTYLNGL